MFESGLTARSAVACWGLLKPPVEYVRHEIALRLQHFEAFVLLASAVPRAEAGELPGPGDEYSSLEVKEIG